MSSRPLPAWADTARLRLPDGLRLLDVLVEEASNGFALVDRELRFLRVNPSLARLHGRPARDHIGRTLTEVVPGAASEETEQRLRQVVTSGERIVDVEVSGRTARASGEPRGSRARAPAPELTWVESYYPLALDGELLAVGLVAVDVTGRRLAEQRLRAREESLRIALESSETGAWQWAIGEDAIEWSESVAAVHGLPPGTATPARFEDYLALVHPEDRPRLEAAVQGAVERGDGYELEWRVVGAGGETRWIWARATIAPASAGRPTRLVGITRDVSRRRRADEQREFLERASETLFSSHDYEHTLAETASLAVQHLADWCAVDLLEDGWLVNVAVAHVDPGRVALATELQRRYPPDAGAATGPANVVRTGTSELYEQIADEMLVAGARDAEHLEIMRSLGLYSAMVVPLGSGEQVLGAITLVSAESGRRYGAEDLAFAEELARRASLAIDNARLHALEREARRQAQRANAQTLRLQRVTERLSAAAGSAEIVEVVLSEGTAALEADCGRAHLREGDELVLAGAVGCSRAVRRRLARIALAEAAPEADACRGTAVLMESVAEHRDRYPFLADEDPRDGSRALIALPLASNGDPIGTVSFGFRSPRPLIEADRELAETMARLCTQALERARLYEREHAIAEALQRSMLPGTLPSVPGLRLAARYLPGVEGLDVGGDWFDATALEDGRLAVTVGDVVGKGVVAAAVMGQLRNALRVFALEGYAPGDVVRRLSLLSRELPGDQFATLAHLVVDPASGACEYANAGHPVPLVRDSHGQVRWLEGGTTVPLGTVDEPVAPATAAEQLGSGETLLLYTDGLVERRDRPLAEGLALLEHAVGDGPRDLDELLEHVLQRLDVDRREDDVALLGLALG